MPNKDSWAEQLGMSDAANLLQETLDEEESNRQDAERACHFGDQPRGRAGASRGSLTECLYDSGECNGAGRTANVSRAACLATCFSYFNDWGGRTGVLERVDYAQVGETTKLPTGGIKPQPRKGA